MKNLFKSPILILIPLILAVLYLIPGSINNKILETEITFYQWIQTAEPLSDDIVVITIDDEDVGLLGGWPISRDYYSYAIHALHQGGSNVIGLDVFFSGQDKRYPRYDSTMAEFISSAGKVVLPMFFSELQKTNSEPVSLVGRNPHYSIPVIKQSAAALGFSNLGPDPVIFKIPLTVQSHNNIYYSFAVELFRVFNGIVNSDKRDENTNTDFPSNQDENLFLNYPDFDNYKPNYSFVNLLQTYRNNPDSISMSLNGKIAIIINTITGVSQVKSIPLNDRVPASFIHIAALNNLLLKNWLVVVPSIVGTIIILLFGFVFLSRWQSEKLDNIKGISLILPAVYAIVSILLFLFTQLVFPLIYPLSAFFSVLIITKITEVKTRQFDTQFVKKELDAQLDDKEIQLENARNQLLELSNKLYQQTVISDKNHEQIQEQKESIGDFEKELADLRDYRLLKNETEIVEIEGIVYSKTSSMQKVMDLVMKVSSDDIPVLISGETGTGKELIAQTIHEHSNRKQEPFIAINCGALPETLLESELFGHERGSFTGATAMRKGRFELADGGTVFLDEVTETSPAFQARLLRILQESTFERVGGQKQLKTDIRIIAATNKDLQKMIDQDKFRSDLFYRLNGFPIIIPPLREREDDIALLAEHFIKKHGYNDISGFSSESMRILKSYAWPGNVRELENCICRAAILAQSEERSRIQDEDLPQDIKESKSEIQLQLVHKPFEDQILELMRSFKFSRSAIVQTANLLGNRDRGTITEYFKGICFRQIVESELNIAEAVNTIAGSADEILLENIQQKIKDYLINLKNYSGLPAQADIPANEQAPPYRGLPKKFDPYLDQILANLPHLVEQLSF